MYFLIVKKIEIINILISYKYKIHLLSDIFFFEMAGVLLFQKYFKNGLTSLTILLFRERDGKYSLLVGNLNDNESHEHCAQHECIEESRNLFRPSINSLMNSPYVVHNHLKVFVMRVPNNTKSSWYFHNLAIMNGQPSPVPYEWRETDNMVRVDIKDLPLSLLQMRGDIQVMTTDGNQITINGKDKAVIRKAIYEANLISENLPCQFTGTNENYTRGHPWLNGTKCYYSP